MDTDALTAWKNIAQVAAFCLAGLAALAAGVVWFTGRELERRREVNEAQLHDRIAISEQAAATARRDAERLREQLAPRVLSAAQREKVITQLSGVRGHVLITYPADQEAEAFARQLHEAIAAAGWTAFLEGPMSLGPIVGISINVRSLELPPPAMSACRAALEAALGTVPVTAEPSLASDAIEIIVGSKAADQ
jgi:hypothetical protein